ncbi:MAG: NRDE family protein [Bradymonadia bacterium]
MCVIGIAMHVHPQWPVIIAANRDEFLQRPTSGPQQLGVDAQGHAFFGGRDLEKGGTWMGVGAGGFFVGLTNQRLGGGAGSPAPRSRGEVVLEALRLASVVEINAWLSTLPTADYLPFNLMYGTAEAMWVAYVRPDAAPQVEQVPSGIHALPNDVLDSPRFPRAARVVAGMGGALDGLPSDASWPDVSASLTTLLADRTPPNEDERAVLAAQGGELDLWVALDHILIRTPVYGTRSSTLVALSPGAVAGYGFVDGAPGDAPLVDYTHWLRAGE